jgi:hypothetical protein
MGLTIIFVWLYGLGQHRTLYENTFTSTWIISTILFQFLFFGLYKGFKMKEDLGNVIEKPKFESVGSELSGVITGDVSEIEAVFIFILLIPVIIALIINFAIFFWTAILIFIAIFYWVFYRAIKFSFKQSLVCKGNVGMSLLYSLIFTLTYTLWFFTIILGVHYWK